MSKRSFARWSSGALFVSCVLGAGVRAESPPEAPLAISATDAGLGWGPCPPLFPKGCEIAVLHGDPGKPNADVFLRIPAK